MTAKSSVPVTGRDEFERKFMITLIEDAARALQRFESAESVESAHFETQAVRRDLVRSLHATMEGVVWTYREHVVSAAKSLGELSPHEEIAFSEESVRVSEKGTISMQRRSLTIASTIRLTTRIAKRLHPAVTSDFDTKNWANFRSSVTTRNRLTHPKTMGDLAVSKAEASSCIAALYWLIELTITGMEASNVAMKGFAKGLAEAAKGLKAGDPEIMAAYRTVLDASEG